MVGAALLALVVGISATSSRNPCQDVPASRGSGVQLCEVPAGLKEPMRGQLLARRAAIVRTLDSLDAAADEFNRRCGSISPTATDVIARCRSDFDAYNRGVREVEARKLSFNEQVREAMRRGLHIEEPPSPEVQREQARLRDNPAQWLREREQQVRLAVQRNAPWTRDVLRVLMLPRESQRPYEMTRLADLAAGDVILVAPPAAQLDPAGAAGSEAIRRLDERYRMFSELLMLRVSSAARQELEPASHALTYLGDISGVRMYYSQDVGGSRIIDERQFLREYGAREMFVGRPQAVLDGRRLWSAARDAAVGNPKDYGCVGEGKYVCSERTGIIVGRATTLDLTTDRLGPIDVTPGDFFDREGNVGKHFVITRLRITGVPRGTP